jgi:hypothetical protein
VATLDTVAPLRWTFQRGGGAALQRRGARVESAARWRLTALQRRGTRVA